MASIIKRSKRVKFQINPTVYSISVSPLSFPTVGEARKEYARLRAIASKRLKRLESSGYSGTRIYQNYIDRLKPLPKDASESYVRRALADVAGFLSFKTSTVSGQKEARRKQLETMRELGYDFLNESNFDDFLEYMDIVTSYISAQEYGSEDIVDLFEYAEENGIDPLDIADDFRDYLDDEKGVLVDKLKELSREDQEDLEFMKSDELKEPLPVEITDQRRKPEQKRKKSAAQKRADKMKDQAVKMRRKAARRPKSRKRGR